MGHNELGRHAHTKEMPVRAAKPLSERISPQVLSFRLLRVVRNEHDSSEDCDACGAWFVSGQAVALCHA